MPSEGLFGPIFVPPAVAATVNDKVWLQALLDVEAALAAAEAEHGLVPPEAAQAIADGCICDEFDLALLGQAAVAGGNPVIPLVRALMRRLPPAVAPYVHFGATSQDILDSATSLVLRHVLATVLADLAGVATACDGLAVEHRHALMVGRTLLQHAVPITFGLKVAGWLAAVADAHEGLHRVATTRLAVQLGGPAGTLAVLGDRGAAVADALADRLGLARAPLPWHTARARVVDVGAALGVVAGVMAKITYDIALLMQTEVGEAEEGAGGGSSSMPHKRNPVGAAAVGAAARRVTAAVGVLFGALPQEHERAVGGWHAEWEPLREALLLTAGAVVRTREVLEHLVVHPDVMAANLERTDGLVFAEQLAAALAPALGRAEAGDLVAGLSERAGAEGRSLRAAASADEQVSTVLAGDALAAVFDASGALGATDAFIDRARAAWAAERGGRIL